MLKSIIIRGIPEDLHKALKIKAAQEGLSLQAVVIRALEREAASTAKQAASKANGKLGGRPKTKKEEGK